MILKCGHISINTIWLRIDWGDYLRIGIQKALGGGLFWSTLSNTAERHFLAESQVIYSLDCV